MPTKLFMWRFDSSLQKAQRSSTHRRAFARPMTRRQEQVFFGAVFAAGILAERLAVLDLFPAAQ
jgi:hypothetical protein